MDVAVPSLDAWLPDVLAEGAQIAAAHGLQAAVGAADELDQVTRLRHGCGRCPLPPRMLLSEADLRCCAPWLTRGSR
jgi:hypothetical protein